jgi:curved DNA-binding protein CbpA
MGYQGDYYELLQVSRSAESRAIHRAARDLKRRTHPDVGGDADQFMMIQEAERVLTSPERVRYDAWLARRDAVARHGRQSVQGQHPKSRGRRANTGRWTSLVSWSVTSASGSVRLSGSVSFTSGGKRRVLRVNHVDEVTGTRNPSRD